MSAIHSGVPKRTDGANTGPKTDTEHPNNITPDSDQPLSTTSTTTTTTTTTAASPFQQGKVVHNHAYHSNGYGVPQVLVRQQPRRVSKKQRIGSTTSVCTTVSKKSCKSTTSKASCKSTASQIQEVAGDDRCAHCALACLFCEFVSLCSLALDCGGCVGCLEACCGGDGGETVAKTCCGEAGGGICPCGLGCGMLQDCCNSSDCLEICLECCSICFPG
ncbi:hypothetical protein JRQ81_003663 [Phrynocephalus forsythii]|uniref:MyoD family inhibitor domain-containing protein n=1 Tax=Phrynocephalus forsythii TaxID=171643 RepID=A0A9Q0XL24_9SAUR|nr:hypothetical protein JRQ81_003663 [Phrynocephalus forsythii]